MLNQPTSSPMIMMMLGFGCWAATGTAVSATAMKSATRTSHPLRFGHRIALSLAFQAIEPRAHSHRRISPSSFLLHRTTVVVFAETTWLLDLRPTAMEPSDRLSHSSIPADRRPHTIYRSIRYRSWPSPRTAPVPAGALVRPALAHPLPDDPRHLRPPWKDRALSRTAWLTSLLV